MNPSWGPTIVTLFFGFIGLAVLWGMLRQSNSNLVEKVAEIKTDFNKRIDGVDNDLQKHKEKIWPEVNDAREAIAKIKGRLGINGDDMGRGMHV